MRTVVVSIDCMYHLTSSVFLWKNYFINCDIFIYECTYYAKAEINIYQLSCDKARKFIKNKLIFHEVSIYNSIFSVLL